MPIRKSDILRLADVGLRGYGLYHGVKGAQESRNLAKRKFDVMYGTEGKPGLEQQRIGIARDYLGIAGRKTDIAEKRVGLTERGLEATERQIPVSQHDFSPATVTAFKGMVKMGQGEAIAKAYDRVFKTIEGWADDPSVTKGVAFERAMANKDTLYKMVQEDAKKAYENALKTDPTGQGAEAQALLNQIDQLSADKEGSFIQKMFPGVVAEIEASKKHIPYGETKEGYLAGLRSKEKVAKTKKEGEIKPTRLMQEVPFFSKLLGIPQEEALDILNKSNELTEEQAYKEFFTSALRAPSLLSGDEKAEEAKKAATTALDAIRPYLRKTKKSKDDKGKEDPLGILK